MIDVKTLDGHEKIGTVSFYPDSAADCTIMGQHMLGMINVKQEELEPPDHEGVDAANKSSFRMVGRVKVTFEYYGRSVQDEIHVVEDKTDLLVSWDICKALGILHENYPEPIPITKEPPGARAITTKLKDDTAAAKHKEDSGLAEKLLEMVGNKEDPSESDRKRLEDLLMKEFSDVFSVEEKLEPMNCPPMSIHLKPGAIPTYTFSPLSLEMTTEH